MASKCNHSMYEVLRIDVRGMEYKVYLWPKDAYQKFQPGSMACMSLVDVSLHFSEQFPDLKTIKHEVAHAYIKSNFMDYTNNLEADDLEEVACEVIAHFDLKMIETSKLIHRTINLAIKERNGKSRKKVTKKRPGKAKRR